MNSRVSGSEQEENVGSSFRWSVRRCEDVSGCRDGAMCGYGVNEELDVDMDVDCMDGDDVCVSENTSITNCKCVCVCVCVCVDMWWGWVT